MYLPALADHPDAVVQALCGRRREPTDALAHTWNVPLRFERFDELIASGEIDAVIVATPNDSHASIAGAALDAKLAVLCDKPLALDAAGARALARRAAEGNVATMVPFTYRYMPTSRLTHRLIAEGAIGTPHHLNARYYAGYARGGTYAWRWDRDIAGSGVIGDLGSHWLDLARWLLGEVVAVSAHATIFVPKGPRPDGADYDQTEDHAIIHTRHANGAIATLEVSAVATEASQFGQKHLLEVHGSDGSIEAVNDWQFIQRVRLLRRGETVASEQWPADIVDGLRLGSVADTYHDVFRTTPAMTRGWATAAAHGQLCQPDFGVGARVQELVDAAIASAAAGGGWEPTPPNDGSSGRNPPSNTG